MANLKSIKADANNHVKTLVEYLRKSGLLGDSIRVTLRDFIDEREEALYNAALTSDDLARRIATL